MMLLIKLVGLGEKGLYLANDNRMKANCREQTE